ncbi:LCP family protein [Bifidobacterium cuniculi]|uniref:Transcriptional regulator n=1 Tax=Bifidobacterium cuniculi TaxID=1688 RepID=A0A087B459_9BIFI|nr:LCP family protein [Bifidobacterium cuniculi]KFI65809.1 transcriptional regulator [Bifidobacterium cuniculi]
MSYDDGSGTPPSFAPRHSRADADATPQPSASTPPSFAPKQGRSASGGTRHAGTASAPASASPAPRAPRQPAGSAPSPARQRTKAVRPHRIRNRVIAVLVVLALALGCTVAGLWHWVDSGLHREEWIPAGGPAASSATTWLLLGSDERDGTTGDDTPGERTDTILVLTKPKHGPSSLISIPRDSLLEINGNYLKINAAMQEYGRQALVEQVEDITGHRVDHVVKMTFGGLTKVVDALGGVELCYDADVDDEKSELHWTAGCHVADGKTALAFSRMRYSDPKGDFGRSERQQQVIGAIAKKALSPSTLLNFSKLRNVGDAALDAVTVDEATNPMTLVHMLLAFRDASGDQGITGSLYWSDPGYVVDGVGSCVLLDNDRNLELFDQLNDGTHAAGTVGSASEL